VQGGIGPNAYLPSEEDNNVFVRSLPHTEFSDGTALQQPDSRAEDPQVQTADNVLRCDECGVTFPKRHLLNTHLKKHDPPFPCTWCDKAFRYRKDLDRHLKAKHPGSVEDPTPLYCPYPECKFGSKRGTGSSRKDNLQRHIRTRHGG